MKEQQKSLIGNKVNELNDSPIPVDIPRMTSDISIATQPMPQYPSMGNNIGSLITINRSVVRGSYNSSMANNVAGAAGATEGGGNAAGLAWFGAHFKEIAIVAGASAILAALVKIVKVANKEIKVRYNKVVKSLQTIQKDFVLGPNGLDPNVVLKGQGSRIADFAARMFTFNLFNKKRNAAMDKMKTNVGLYPFCDRYKNEIAADFKCAVDSFNKIKACSEQTSADNNSDISGDVYSSFRMALGTERLNEESINEAFNPSLALPALGAKGGQFIIGEIGEDGKVVKGTEKKVQVSKESVREICGTIVYNFLNKYVDGNKLLQEVGIKSASLSDLDASTIDKLKSLMSKYAKPEKNVYNTQFNRLKTAYDNMLKHYYAIGDGIIKNFEKYTEVKDEKHANLLVAGKEKLQAMWDSQKDMLDNNFSHVLIEITTSDAYIAYLDFILENVLPVFKSGIAGDADYVLDVMPRKNQYYLIRQTLNDANLNNDANGNVAMCRIDSFDDKTMTVKFRLLAGVPDSAYIIDDNGLVYITRSDSFDYEKYKNDKGKGREVELPYGKFLSLDPLLADWTPEVYGPAYTRTIKEGSETYTEYVYAYVDSEKSINVNDTEYTNIVYASYSVGSRNFVKTLDIKLDKPITSDEFKGLVTQTSEEKSKNMGFAPVYGSGEDVDRIKRLDKESVKAKDNDAVVEIINSIGTGAYIRSASELYTRVLKNDSNREIVEYVFAELSGDLNSVMVDADVQRLNDSKMNEADADKGKQEVVKPGDKKASKNLIVKVYCSNVDKKSGKEVYDNMEESKFDGAIIIINPAASVDDLSRVFEQFDPKLVTVSDNADRIKESIVKNINRISKFDQTLPEKYDITKLSDAVKIVENRADKLALEESGAPSYKLDQLMKKLSLSVSDYQKGVIYTSKGNFLDNVSGNPSGDNVYRVSAGNRKVSMEGYVKLYTNEKKGDEEISINVYPVLAPIKDNAGKVSYKSAVILAIEDENGELKDKVTSLYEPGRMKDKLDSLISAYIENKDIKDDFYQSVVISGDALGALPSEEFKKSFEEFFSKVKVDKVNKKIELEGGKFSNNLINAVAGEDGKTINLSIKMSSLVKLTVEYSFDEGKVYVYYTGNRKSALVSKSFKPEDIFEAIYNKCKSMAAENLNVKYEHSIKVNERYEVERIFSENKTKGWYMIAESSFDNGTPSLLEGTAFRNRLKSKSDIMNYSKKNANVSVSPFKEKSKIMVEAISDVYGNSICETLMLVKFDSDGKVLESIYLGKCKLI